MPLTSTEPIAALRIAEVGVFRTNSLRRSALKPRKKSRTPMNNPIGPQKKASRRAAMGNGSDGRTNALIAQSLK
ncbi:MAG: hypothetical protein DMG89_02520 [Acidobacteria bacterium]|nr:MAG: hypothetical protein DMG89_02520 [Acidobacteriota bacterium]